MSRRAAQDSKSWGHYLLESMGAIFAQRREELKKKDKPEEAEDFSSEPGICF